MDKIHEHMINIYEQDREIMIKMQKYTILYEQDNIYIIYIARKQPQKLTTIWIIKLFLFVLFYRQLQYMMKTRQVRNFTLYFGNYRYGYYTNGNMSMFSNIYAIEIETHFI